MSSISIEQAVGLTRRERRKRGMYEPGPNAVAHCHKKIRDTAKGMARVLFDELMRRNEIYAKFREQHFGMTTKQMEELFVQKVWPQLIEPARATLAGMLRGNYPDAVKDEIHEVLVLDAQLIRGRKNPARMLGALPAK